MSKPDADSVTSEAAKLLTKCRALSSRALVHSKRFAADADAIREELDTVLPKVNDLKAQAKNLPEAQRHAAASQIRECDMALRKGPGGDLRKFLKKQRKPLLLRLLLGNHCPVHATRSEDGFKMKDEYHKFRSQAARTMILISGTLCALMWRSLHHDTVTHSLSHATAKLTGGRVQLPGLVRHSFTPMTMVGVQAFLVYMVYVYMAMAARESVLLLNGSNIRSWWIWHHYIAALTCIITLALPVDSHSLQSYVEGWLHWTILQALLMILQNMYQRKRMYTRIALGKSSAMDVVGGESSGMPGQLLALLPGLFVLQGWQVYMGVKMMVQTGQAVINKEGWLEMERHETDLRALRGLFAVGTLLAGMGILNAFNTIQTIVAKKRTSAAQRQRAKAQ